MPGVEAVTVLAPAGGRAGAISDAATKPLFIEGRLKYDTWDDKNGGGKRSKLTVVVDSFQFVGGPREERDSDSQTTGESPQPRQRRQSNRQMTLEAPGSSAATATTTSPEKSPVSERVVFTEADIPF